MTVTWTIANLERNADIAAVVHTQEVKDAYAAKKAEENT